jgi:ribonuclease HII
MPNFTFERQYYRRGLSLIAGLDEVGRGAWAGPLVASAVILPPPSTALRKELGIVNDSKQLSPPQREACAIVIERVAVAWAVGAVEAAEVDGLGVTRATHEAMRRALAGVGVSPQALLLDAFPLPLAAVPQKAIIRGDALSYSIASASIMAKVARDAIMRELATRFPAYGFQNHKGYGTSAHQAALLDYGPTHEHRHLFAPVRALTDSTCHAMPA